MKPIFPILILAAALTGCTAHHELAMNPVKSPVVDDSAFVAGSPGFKRILMVPPAGRTGADAEDDLATIERELMRNGVTPIYAPGASGDAAKTFAAAREAGADAMMEITRFGPARASERTLGARFFAPEDQGTIREIGDEMQRMILIKSGNRPVVETDEASHAKVVGDARQRTRVYEDEVMEFSARLVEVKSREITASIHYYAPGVRCGRPYFEVFDDKGKITAQAYDWNDEEARRMRRAAARKAIIKAVADRIAAPR